MLNSEKKMLRLGLQFFAAEGAGDGGTPTTGTTETTTAATETTSTETTPAATETAMTSEEIKRLIQQSVDTRTADLGKKISELRRENETLKKANMTAEQIAQAEKEEFERQKSEVEKQRREIHAHRVVAAAGFGTDADAVVDIVLGDTDERTDERLKNFKALVDRLVAARVSETFKNNGRVPNGSQTTTETKPEMSIAERLGKAKAEQAKQSNTILEHYIGGKK